MELALDIQEAIIRHAGEIVADTVDAGIRLASLREQKNR
jgi:hypothetical protein